MTARQHLAERELARHLGLSRSRVSEPIIRLTDSGQEALTTRNGLDPEAIRTILDTLDEGQQERVLEGLRLLARAVREKPTRGS